MPRYVLKFVRYVGDAPKRVTISVSALSQHEAVEALPDVADVEELRVYHVRSRRFDPCLT